jgi:hypothetical protein
MLQRAKALADSLEYSSVALYRRDETDEPLFEASGFYVDVRARRFFVTAAHSIRSCDGRPMLLTGGGNGIAPDARPWLGDDLLPKSSTARDIGVIPLTAAEAATVRADIVIDSALLSSEIVDSPLAVYCTIGLRAKRQIRNLVARTYELSRTTYTASEAAPIAYQQVQVSHDDALLLRFRRETILGGNGRGGIPDFRGLSGAPVWRVDAPQAVTVESAPHLAGIVVERPARNRKVLLCVRAVSLISLLRAADPELRELLPLPTRRV